MRTINTDRMKLFLLEFKFGTGSYSDDQTIHTQKILVPVTNKVFGLVEEGCIGDK